MIYQWKDELENRFGLTFEVLDKDYMKKIRLERGFGVNPWSTHSRFLVSHRLLIDESYAGPLRDWLGDFRGGTLLILDEAHHAAPSSGQKYAIDSHITRAVRDLAPRFEHRLFLSATPHNGHSNSFTALLEILDPQRFFRGGPVTKKMLEEVMVRRLKDDIRQFVPGFPKREVIQINIDGLPASAPELRLSALLDEYRRLREQRVSTETRRKQAAAGLLITNLQQRLLSSIEAFSRTLRVHRKTVKKHWEFPTSGESGPKPADPLMKQLNLLTEAVGNDDERANMSEDQLHADEESLVAAVSAATVGPISDAPARDLFAREQKLLDEMTEIAEASHELPDARVLKLIDWIRAKMCPGLPAAGIRSPKPATWNDTRILIFTEYDDTKRYLHQQLSAAIDGTDRADDRIAIFHGPTPHDEREAIKLAFNANPSRHPLRILIATDAAREGLNLQAHCANLFHFDVPWNPSRMEQRNGRIDRKLQPRPEVFCHYFVYNQRPEDRILVALVRKTETIKKELGSLAQVIDARLADTLRTGIRRDQLDALEREIETADLDPDRRHAVDEELEATRERQHALAEQIDRLRTLLAESQKSIGLDKEHFRSAISCALELIGAEPLKPAKNDDGKGAALPRSLFPALDRREGADPTWADTMDTLRAPRSRDQKPWEWRRVSPIRPVVFEDPGTMDDEVVHLHLEQRVVQRLLGRFTAQGFVHHDLSRACLTQTSDAIPRVVLLGRLSLYGPAAARLHEELIPVTARWVDPQLRKEPVKPYARESETRTLGLLDQALLSGTGPAMTDQLLKQLQAAAPRDVQELLPHLQARGEEYARDAGKMLIDRAAAEAKAMRDILETQKKHITEIVAKHSKPDLQLRLGFAEDELRQLESNRRYRDKHLLRLEDELKTEPDRVRDIYQVKATRIEPVGLVYLWPVTG
jgi:superfamily II DNA or RNA helicase